MKACVACIVGAATMIASSLLAFTQGAAPDAANRSVVAVSAQYPWIDSGLIVRKGDRLTFRAEGTIRWGDRANHVAGPGGYGAKAGKVGAGGLIGRVGFSGKPFPIGNSAIISMPKDGKLFLGINDFVFADNSGAFSVTIIR